ncbi:MAG TPA: tetratricopeptide repeat protein [Bryobacteraceae bacterium]|nr:tetratricopeptide repeat protein [Bryobacteraceae bacterium]
MTEAMKNEWTEEALAHFSQVIARPENAAAHLNLGIWLEGREHWDQAAQSFGRALALNPEIEAAQIGLGMCLLKLDRVEQSLEVFKRSGGPGLFGQAVALQLLGRFDEAASAYESWLESKPNSEEALANLIAISADTHDLEHMREYSQRLLSIAPQSPVALQGLATVALERRDNHAAARYCDRILELAPDCLEGWHNLRIALDRIVSAFMASKPAVSIPGVK